MFHILRLFLRLVRFSRVLLSTMSIKCMSGSRGRSRRRRPCLLSSSLYNRSITARGLTRYRTNEAQRFLLSNLLNGRFLRQDLQDQFKDFQFQFLLFEDLHLLLFDDQYFLLNLYQLEGLHLLLFYQSTYF